jgi:hypothetical protein
MRVFVGLAVLASTIVGCHSSDPFDPRNLSYEATTQVSATKPVKLETTVIARNVSDRIITVNGNHCLIGLKAWREPQREGPPAWDSRTGGACDLIAIQQTLIPGDYLELQITGTLPTDLPAGRYYLSADVDFLQVVSVPAGQIEYF